jgi:hypothetical protein
MRGKPVRKRGEVKHIVGFSGGIDSQAAARWVLNRYPKEDVILLNSDAGGNEHPITSAHITWYSEHIHPVVCVSPRVADIWEGDLEPMRRVLKEWDDAR